MQADTARQLTPQSWTEAFASLIGGKGLFLIAFFAFSMTLDQTMTELMQNEMMSPEGASPVIWLYGAVSFLMGLLTPLVVTFTVLTAWRMPRASLGQAAGQHLGYLIREEMRVAGKSLLWALLLIIPGLIRFFQCLFVPFVVLLDPEYQKGEVDALQRSWVFVRRTWGRLLLLAFVFGLLIPLMMTSFDGYRSLVYSPLTGLPLFVVELTIVIVFQWSLLKTWERAHEPDVPLVRN